MNTIKTNEMKMLADVVADLGKARSENRMRDAGHHIEELRAIEMHTEVFSIKQECRSLLSAVPGIPSF